MRFRSQANELPAHEPNANGRRASVAVCIAVLGLVFLAFDERLQQHLTRWGVDSPYLGATADYWQRLAEWPGILIFLAAPLVLIRQPWPSFTRFVGCLVLTGFFAQVIKHLVGRARPSDVGDESRFFGPFGLLAGDLRVQVDSMPSGHTAAAFCMATVLVRQWPRLRYLWWTLATGVGVARTLVDRHFPSDVIFGALLGTGVAMVTLRRFSSWSMVRVSNATSS